MYKTFSTEFTILYNYKLQKLNLDFTMTSLQWLNLGNNVYEKIKRNDVKATENQFYTLDKE